MKTQTRNWLTAVAAIGFLFGLAAVLAALSGQRRSDRFFNRPSTFFTDESGARALLLVMRRLLPSAEQWRRPLDSIPLPNERKTAGTLIVAGPSKGISRSEARHLDRWLTAGGQLVLATRDGWPVTQRLSKADQADAAAETTGGKPDEPKAETYLARHAAGVRFSKPGKARIQQITGRSLPDGALEVESRQPFAAVGNLKVLAAAGDAVLAVEIPVGQGRIVALADPTIVSNRALRAADNAVWLVTLAGGWGNGNILFDEYHHGFGAKRGTAALLWEFFQTPWGWCVMQIFAAGFLYVFAYRRRFGKIHEPPVATRASPLELVDARAGIFQAAQAQKLAIDLLVQDLGHGLAAARGQRGKAFNRSRGPDADPDSATTGLARLQALASKASQGQKIADREFIEAGRIAAGISQGSRS